MKKLAPFHVTIEIGLLTACVLLFFLPVEIPWILPVILFLINSIIFYIFKDYETLNTVFLIYRINIIFYILLIIKCFGNKLEATINTSINLFVSVFVCGGISICAACLLFVDNEKKKKFVTDLPSPGLIGKEGKIESDYDIVICKDADTGRDVILHEEDRFLHLFIDGPTGSGKTSQVLLPMINQDIKKGHGITVIEPKGELAAQCYALCNIYGRKDYIFFNPIDPDCPKFNVLDGREDVVTETVVTTFLLLSPESNSYYQNMTDNLLRNTVMVVKRLEEVYMNPETGISSRPATMLVMSDIINNPNNRGSEILKEFAKMPTIDNSVKKQNQDIVDYFINDYYVPKSIAHQNTSGVRSQLNKLVQNKYLRKVLNPENGKSEIDFSDAFENQKVVIISTAQGILRELSSYLGMFIMYNMQSSVFRRPGTEDTRVPHILYIDEAQRFVRGGFAELLEQGRSYRVSVNMATQARRELGDGTPKDKLLESISANTRNNIAFPGISPEDRKYFQDLWGEEKVVKTRRGETRTKFSIFGGGTGSNGSESTTYEEVNEARISATDIAFKKFSEITYGIVVNKDVQVPGNGIARFLPRELSDKMKVITRQYEEEITNKQNIIDAEESEKKAKLFREYKNDLASDNNNGDRGSAIGGKNKDNDKGKAINSGGNKKEPSKKIGGINEVDDDTFMTDEEVNDLFSSADTTPISPDLTTGSGPSFSYDDED